MWKKIVYCILAVALVGAVAFRWHDHEITVAADTASYNEAVAENSKGCPVNDGSYTEYHCVRLTLMTWNLYSTKCELMQGAFGWYGCEHHALHIRRPFMSICIPIDASSSWYACKYVGGVEAYLQIKPTNPTQVLLPWYASIIPQHHWNLSTTPCPALDGSDGWYACKLIGVHWYQGQPLFNKPAQTSDQAQAEQPPTPLGG